MKKILLATAVALGASAALADYPDKPVTIVVPFAAGGPTDKVARDLAEAMRKGLNNQSLVVENVAGAGGTLGAAKVAKANKDGYTLLRGAHRHGHCAGAVPHHAVQAARTTSNTSAWSTRCR